MMIPSVFSFPSLDPWHKIQNILANIMLYTCKIIPIFNLKKVELRVNKFQLKEIIINYYLSISVNY